MTATELKDFVGKGLATSLARVTGRTLVWV